MLIEPGLKFDLVEQTDAPVSVPSGDLNRRGAFALVGVLA